VSTVGEVRPWHDLDNPECPQNGENIDQDCTCKLVIQKTGKKRQKPRIIFRVHDARVDHRVKPDLWVEIHDNGDMILRENQRRVVYATSVGKEYCRLQRTQAFATARARKAESAAKRKGKRQ
jgi:hypothetical protein